MRIFQQQLSEDKFIDMLTKWEFDISEHGRVSTERLLELLKLTLLTSKMSVAM